MQNEYVHWVGASIFYLATVSFYKSHIMAKKVIAKLKDSSGKNMVKVIKSVISPKTGAYTFKHEILTIEDAKKSLSGEK